METVVPGARQRFDISPPSFQWRPPILTKGRDALPSLGLLDLDKAKRDGMERRQRLPGTSGLSISTAPLVSPTTMYSGPPPPYSYPSSTVSSAPPGSGYISPPESRRTTEDEKEHPPSQRQSLPSIQEALSGDKSISYPNPPSINAAATSRPPYLTPAASTSRSFPDAPSGPSNPFSHPPAPTSSQHEATYTQPTSHPLPVRSESESSRPAFSSISSGDSRPPSLNTFPFSKSPHLNTGAVPHPLPQVHSTLGSDIGPGLTSSPRPGASAYSNQGPHPPHPPSASSSAYPPPHWEFDERRKAFPRPGPDPPYSDSVKRHLDIYESEMALTDISEGSSRTLDFARIIAQRAHETQRSGLPLEALPSVQEVDDVLRQSSRVTEALSRIRDIIITQQHVLAEQQARAFKGDSYEDELNGFHDDFKGGGFSGGDAKKRRGKAAPPGRCHSCNRAETPEWRRGPDGARTLCNACGLHYAKLTRKLGATKASTLTVSNLRPKTLDSRSPHQ